MGIHEVGSESSITDGLSDTHVYKEIAMAKLLTKQNLNRRLLNIRSKSRGNNPSRAPNGPQHNTRPIRPKSGTQHHGQKKDSIVNQ